MCCLAQLPAERKFPVQIPQQPDEIGETVGQTIDQSNQHMNEPWGKRKPSKDVDKEVCMLVQEWFARCYNQNLNNIIFDRQRICSDWIIICKKIFFMRYYQGKDRATIQRIMEYFEQKIEQKELKFPPTIALWNSFASAEEMRILYPNTWTVSMMLL